MVTEALGDCAFYGTGEPQSFMTDNYDAERKTLAATWSTSQRLLCIFHILQQVWRWLLDSKHGIHKHNRQELMVAMKTLVHSKSKEEFNYVCENIQASALTKTYPSFGRYFHST